MHASIGRYVFAVSAVAVSALSMAAGVSFLLGAGEFDLGGEAMRIGVAFVLVVSGVLILVGLWRLRNSRFRGSGMVAAGAVPLGICFWWTGVAPALSLLMVVVGIIKARSAAKGPALPSSSGTEARAR